MKIAVILPSGKSDYLANTVLDGLIELSHGLSNISFFTTLNYPNPFDLEKYQKSEVDFIEFAKTSDMIILAWGKNSTNYALADKINEWNKTVFVDGSELGKNNRFDLKIHQAILDGSYTGIGAIDQVMLSKCKIYFRREKPYINGIIPLPFGIESRYMKYVDMNNVKDIDFTCIFGQDEYPILRRQANEYVKKFSRENAFTCHTKKTDGFNFDDNTKKAGRDDFHQILSRTKVGVSIGGGGFDTARFWEILGSGAMLMTEKIDIYDENSHALKYRRVIEFKDFEDFKLKIGEIGNYLRNGYDNDKPERDREYRKVIESHRAADRVLEIIKHFNEK